jgi:hypothetical protein
MERLNIKNEIYICWNADGIQFGSVDINQANKYARQNNCNCTTYPAGCYNESKEFNFFTTTNI